MKILRLTFILALIYSFAFQFVWAANKAAVLGPELDRKYCQSVLGEVDKTITKRIYSEKLAKEVWPKSLNENKEKILASKNLVELQERMTKALEPLASSHLNFVTSNDPMNFYLRALFCNFDKGKFVVNSDRYTGFVTGGAGFARDKIRYVVNDSPASDAGLRVGDKIITVDTEPYVGLLNFKSEKKHQLEIVRDGQKMKLSLFPVLTNYYSAYNRSLAKSAKIMSESGKKIGYVHVWSGGTPTHDLLDSVLREKLQDTDGLVVDMRDGYGGNYLDDLDRFFRKPEQYPEFISIDRKGKESSIKYTYDKPVVALINKGSRSGKEILAYVLKKTKRAKLVGDTTGGAVLAGSLKKLNADCSLYMPVLDVKIDGVRLEGSGVEPDFKIENKSQNQAGYDKQFSEAKRILLDQIEGRAGENTESVNSDT